MVKIFGHKLDLKDKSKSPQLAKICIGVKTDRGNPLSQLWQIELITDYIIEECYTRLCSFGKAQLFLVKRKATMLPQFL